MISRLTLACIALIWTSAASADEAIKTGTNEAPPAAPVQTAAIPQSDPSAQAIGDWAQGVMAGAPSPEEPKPDAQRCEASPDKKPHGAVWGGVGTGGYRNVGGVVTQPVGKCGSVTVMIDHTEGNYGRRYRGR